MGQSDLPQQILAEQQTSGRTAELAALNQKLETEMTERKRVEEALQQRSRELSALNTLSHRVSASLSLDQVVQAALEGVVDSVAVNLALLYTRHGDELHLQGSYQKGLELQHATAQLHRVGECLCGLAISQGRPIYSSDIHTDVRCTLEECKAAGVRSFAALPLVLEGQVLGVLGMASIEEQDFGEQTAYLEALAGTIVIGLQNALLHQQVQSHASALEQQVAECKRAEQALQESEARFRQRSTELVALHGISLHLNTVQDLPDLLRLIVDRAVNLLGAFAGGIYLYDELQDVLTFTMGTGFVAEFVGRTLKPGEGLAGQVFTRRQAMTVADYATWPGRAAAFDGDLRLKAQLAAPLYVAETVFGVLTIQGAEGQVFGEHDVWLVEMFGSQATVALENARLHEETQRRANLLAALNTAGRAMSSSLDLESVLNQVIEEVRSLLGAEGASIILRDPTSGELIFAAAAGQGSQELIGTRIPINTGVAGWVVRERQSVLVHDAQTDPRFWNVVDSKTHVTTRSLVAVPLKYKASVWGVIEAINRAGGRFDKLDQEMLEASAGSAAIAIENARLYGAEKELRRLVEQSQIQLAESEKLAATGRLAATLAHEINNPLQAISNSLQLMLNFDLEADERRECVQLATSEVERLAGIVSRTLDVARRPQAEVKPANLNQVIEKVLALTSKYLQHRHIALERNLAPDLQPIRANPDELAQVFLNLILNAVDAMPESGTLRVSTGPAEDSFITATFSDTGCGILPENLERIFEPFFTTKSDGTGLGLSVSTGVVSRHGGKITVQSQVNQGTTFIVWLPAATY